MWGTTRERELDSLVSVGALLLFVHLELPVVHCGSSVPHLLALDLCKIILPTCGVPREGIRTVGVER